MPPLAELSVNRPGKTKQANLNGTSTGSGKRQPPSSVLDSNASTLPAASAIQSMLKNTTELGDIDQLVAKPTKFPRQKSNAIAHSRSQQHHPGKLCVDHAVRNNIAEGRHHHNYNQRRGQPLHHSRSLGTNGGHSLISDSQDPRSDSITQSSSNSRRVSVHPSLLNIRPYARGGPRPRPPYAYPSRLKRLGHRPASPPYSEINISDSAIHTSIHRAYSTRTGSPLSTSSMRKVPQPWMHGFNRSDPLLQCYPAAPLTRRHDGNRSPPFLRRAALSGSPLASHRSSLMDKSGTLKPSGSSSSAARANHSPPLFYDYSEAFEKESFHHTAQRSSLFSTRHILQSDGSSEGYQADVTNTSNTSNKSSSSFTVSKAITPEQTPVEKKLSSPWRFVSQHLRQKPTKHNKASGDQASEPSISSEVVIGASDDTSLTKTSLKDDVFHKKVFESPKGKEKMTDPFTASSPLYNDLQRPASTYDPAPKVVQTAAVALRLSSSSSGSQYSTSAHSRQDKKSASSPIKTPEMAYERQPKTLSVSFNRLDMIRHETESIEPQQRAASLDMHVRPEPCQIFAPVPERSMSSRDSRDRFSRILSIGEDFGKRDIFTGSLPNKKAPMTIQQYLRDRKTPSHKPRSSLTKELPPLPDDPPPAPSKGKEKEIFEPVVDQRGSSQFTDAKQSLEQDADAHSATGMEYAAALNGFTRPGIPPRFSSISKHSLLDMPESSRSARASILSQNLISGEQPRKYVLTPRDSSLFQTMKELPPLPNEAVVSIHPPQTSSHVELPCLFTPLLHEEQLDSAVADIKDSPKAKAIQSKDERIQAADLEQHTPPRPFMVGTTSAPGSSNASHASARPWNLDASYPWAGTPPKLEVSVPQPAKDPAPGIDKLPRFRLNIHRASLLGSNGKLSKHRPPNVKVTPSPAASKEINPVSTRFTEVLENKQNGPPNIALVPPSPGLQIEAQSFFSDDSSRRGQKNSIRRRLSQIRGAMRAASSDDNQAQASPTFSRPSKGSSKRSSIALDVKSPRKSTNWKVLNRIKNWFHRREENIKKWRRKLSPRHHHILHPGV